VVLLVGLDVMEKYMIAVDMAKMLEAGLKYDLMSLQMKKDRRRYKREV
jgi:hypothetical protein